MKAATRGGKRGGARTVGWVPGKRLAVIDIGSNAIRLLAVEITGERTWKSLAEDRAMTRLAHGLAETGCIAPEALERSAEAVARFAKTAREAGATPRAFATAAVREAGNRDEFLKLVRQRAGLEIELVSALEEGRCTFRSAARVFDVSHGWAGVADIGGGSLEIALSRDGVMVSNESMPLGALRLTEQFGGAVRCAGERYDELRRHVRKVIQKHVHPTPSPPGIFIGGGGTCTTILTLACAMRGVYLDRGSPALRGAGSVSRGELRHMIESLRHMPLEERLRVPGLPADRADIAVAGFTVIERLMSRLHVRAMFAHPGGFREGLILRMVEEEEGFPGPSGLDAARALARTCQYPAAHSEHVAHLALPLFDGLENAGVLKLSRNQAPRARVLLEAAAVLHDIGVMVSYARHHKHSAEIIRQSGLRGFLPSEVEVIAQLARHHRRGGPSPSRSAFMALKPGDRRLVRTLAGVLRVADGLDRDHTQAVASLRVVVESARVRLLIDAPNAPRENMEAALRKGDVLEEVTGRRLSIRAGGGDA